MSPHVIGAGVLDGLATATGDAGLVGAGALHATIRTTSQRTR
jgi:hypothetical protein